MFMSFIAGAVFGVGSGFFEKLVRQPLRDKVSLSDSEVTILSFGALMLVASIVVSAMNFDSSAFWLVLGGMIGAFAIRGYLFSKAKIDERRSKAAAAAEEVAETVEDTVTANS